MYSSMFWEWSPRDRKVQIEPGVSNEGRNERIKFIRRIYTIVGAQILFTFVLSYLFSSFLAAFIITIVFACSVQARRELVVAPIFIALTSLIMSFSWSHYSMRFVTHTLGLSFILTVIIVVAATLASRFIGDITPWCFHVIAFMFIGVFVYGAVAVCYAIFSDKFEHYIGFSVTTIVASFAFLVGFPQLMTGGRKYELEVGFPDTVRSVLVLNMTIHLLFIHVLTIVDYPFPGP